MPTLAEVSGNARELKKRIAGEAGLEAADVNDKSLSQAQTMLQGAQAVQAQGGDPTKVAPAELKAQGATSADKAAGAEKPADVSKQHKIAMAIVAIAPTLLGYALGGKEGGAAGADASQKAIGGLAQAENEDRRANRDIAARKEMQATQLAERRDQAERDRLARLEMNEQNNQTRRETAQQNAELRRDMLASKQGGVKLTKGEEAVDRRFATDYNDYIVQGGYGEAQKNLKNLRETLEQLKGSSTASGPIVGMLPKGVRDTVMPGGAAIQDQIEAVASRSMRQIYGSQFTENEGRQLLARQFNPRQSEAENARRLEGMIAGLEAAAQQKQAAAEYYEANGTLKGFKGAAALSPEMLAQAEPAPAREGGASVPPTMGAAHAAPARPDFSKMSDEELKKYVGR